MRTHSYFLHVAMLGLLLLLAFPCAVNAQRWVTLVDYTNTFWRFDDSRSDLGTTWLADNFDDSDWLGGTGLFGFETNVAAFPFPFVTTLALGPTTDVTTNFYLRAHFNLDSSNHLAGLILWASNYVDDGCVIHLNGIEAGRIRVPFNQNAATYASASVGGNMAIPEGTNEVLQLPAGLLRSGDNVLAVEVHQGAANSSDVVWGMKLSARIPIPSSLLTQPQSQLVEVAHPFTLCVEASGGPLAFQWQTNGPEAWVNIPGATNACYATNVFTPTTNDYRVLCSTPVNTVISSEATVTVLPDQDRGPLIISAMVVEETVRSNRIELRFDEALDVRTVHSPLTPSVLTNGTFRVVLMPSNISIGISNSIYTAPNFPAPPKVTLTMNSTNWGYRSNYYIVLNNIRDSRTNVIAPNTIIPVAWPSNAAYGAFTSPLPPISLMNKITAASPGRTSLQLSWPSNAYGWALERSTNITGPWMQAQPYMANPYVTNFSPATTFFYRLHATQ